MTKPKPPSQNGNLEYVQKRAVVKHKDNNPKLAIIQAMRKSKGWVAALEKELSPKQTSINRFLVKPGTKLALILFRRRLENRIY